MTDGEKIKNYYQTHFGVDKPHLGDEFFYRHLPLCVIDTVFGLSTRYTTVQAIIQRYCEFNGISFTRDKRLELPVKSDQHSIEDYIKLLTDKGTDYFATFVFKNRRPASSSSPKLRAETSLEFAQVLLDYEVNYWQDVHKVINNEKFESDITKIDGMGVAGVRNFAMLAGDKNTVKPDVWILRFLKMVLGRKISTNEAFEPMRNAATELGITARELDHEVWKYMRNNWDTLKKSQK